MCLNSLNGGVSTRNKELGSQYRENIVSALLAELKKCSRRRDLKRGKALHAGAVESGCHTNKYVANAMINVYSKCGSMQDARSVFDKMVYRDVVSWTSLILGYVENEENAVAMELFTSMDCEPNSLTFVAALKACTGLAAVKQFDRQLCLEKGMALHRQAKKRGLHVDMFVENNLIEMYSNCGSMRDALVIFGKMVHCDVVSWNTLILGYVKHGQSLLALELLKRMECEPSVITFVAALKACAALASENESDRQLGLENGMAFHRQAGERGFCVDVFLATNLVDMYSKSGSMQDARAVFDNMLYRDVVSWTSLIMGYVENSENFVALDLLESMDCEPNYVTCVAALKACASLGQPEWLEKGIAVHGRAREQGFDAGMFVATNLVHMYSKCGSIRDARYVFDSMTHRDAVAWTGLLLGYYENGESHIAVDLFRSMDCEPIVITFVVVLKACGDIPTLVVGQTVHAQVCKLGFEQEQVVANSLLDFYGKCGRTDVAEQVFNTMHSWDIVSWSTLIAGYSSLGNTVEVFSVLRSMEEAGLQLNGITVLSVLTTCSHTGMVEEGIKYFEYMYRYGIRPSVEHYTCLVDMLGRANRLQDALLILRRMPFEADSAMWKALLGACRNRGSMEVGKAAFDALIACDTHDSAAYVLLHDMLHPQSG